MTPEERVRGAKALLSDKVACAVLDQLERDAIETWRATNLPDAENREIQYLRVTALQDVRNTLKNWASEPV